MASYRKGVEWVAMYDPYNYNLRLIATDVCVHLLARLFPKVPQQQIARDVLAARLTQYSAPPKGLVHLRGRGNLYHYAVGDGDTTPLCGAEGTRSICDTPNPTSAPYARLCVPCKRVALDYSPKKA